MRVIVPSLAKVPLRVGDEPVHRTIVIDGAAGEGDQGAGDVPSLVKIGAPPKPVP